MKEKGYRALVGGSVFFLSLFLYLSQPFQGNPLVIFVPVAFLTELWSFDLPKRPVLCASTAAYLAGAILLPLPALILLLLGGRLLSWIYQRRFSLLLFVDLVQQTVAFGAASLVLQWLAPPLSALPSAAPPLAGSPRSSTTSPGFLRLLQDLLRESDLQTRLSDLLLSLALLAVATFLVTLLLFLLGGMRRIWTTGNPPERLHWPSFRFLLKCHCLFMAPVGLLMAVLYLLQPTPFPYPLVLLIPPLAVVHRSVRNYVESLRAARSTIEALAGAVEKRYSDASTYHNPRVADLARKIALRMRLPDHELEMIESASKIHDLGKVSISDTILNKAAPLTEEELRKVRRHPIVSAEVASHLSLYERETKLVRHHHERYDGAGYPDGLRGEEVPLGSRIIAVADAFHAMTSPRPYRETLTPEEARLEIQKGKGTQFDPKVVDAFMAAIGEELRADDPDQ